MDKLDDKNAKLFGNAILKHFNYPPMNGANDAFTIGIVIENMYMHFQQEAERDAREERNKGQYRE